MGAGLFVAIRLLSIKALASVDDLTETLRYYLEPGQERRIVWALEPAYDRRINSDKHLR